MRTILCAILLPLFAPAAEPPGFDPAPSFAVREMRIPYPGRLLGSGESNLYLTANEILPPDEESGPLRFYNPIDSANPANFYTPVIRLRTGNRPETMKLLAETLDDVRLSKELPSIRSLQIDFDCLSTSLSEYAEQLAKLRGEQRIRHLSITAHPDWIEFQSFRHLAATVDEIVPRFYNLGDPESLITSDFPEKIAKWKNCPIHWRAELPNFQVLSVYKEDGTLVAHHFEWSPSRLLDHPAIVETPGNSPTIRRFKTLAGGATSDVRFEAGQRLVWRMPDDSSVQLAIKAASEAGAEGIVWSGHPAVTLPSWHSVSHLAAMAEGKPPTARPELRVDGDGALELSNPGPGDLMPRLHDEPWQLVLEIMPDNLADLDPGNFEIRADGNRPGSLVLTFPSLLAGKKLLTGGGFVATGDELPNWTLEPLHSETDGD